MHQAIIDALKQAGCTAEQILAGISAETAIENEKQLERRYKATILKRAQRKRKAEQNQQSCPSMSSGQHETKKEEKERTKEKEERNNIIYIQSSLRSDCAEPAPSPRTELWKRGTGIVIQLTGKPESQARRLIGQFLKSASKVFAQAEQIEFFRAILTGAQKSQLIDLAF